MKVSFFPAKFVVGFFLNLGALGTLIALVLSLRIYLSPSNHYYVNYLRIKSAL